MIFGKCKLHTRSGVMQILP